MTFPIIYDNKILFNGGNLAMSENCCCSGSATSCEEEDCSLWTPPDPLFVDVPSLNPCENCDIPEETWDEDLQLDYTELCQYNEEPSQNLGATLILATGDLCFWELNIFCQGKLPYSSITIDVYDGAGCTGSPESQQNACVTTDDYNNIWFGGSCVDDYPDPGKSSKLVAFNGWYYDSSCTLPAPVTILIGTWRRPYISGSSNRNITRTYTFISGECGTQPNVGVNE